MPLNVDFILNQKTFKYAIMQVQLSLTETPLMNGKLINWKFSLELKMNSHSFI